MGTNHGSANLKRGIVERSILPSQHDHILHLWLEGKSLREISAAVNVPRTTVHKFIEKELRPIARANHARHIGIFLSELTMLRSFAYQQVEKAEEPLEEVRLEYIGPASGPTSEDKLVKRIVRRYPNLTAAQWIGVVQWCLEQEARIAGHYKMPPSRRSQAKFQVSGVAPEKSVSDICEQLYADLIEVRIRRQSQSPGDRHER